MTTYTFQYRREQRVDFTIEASSEEEADEMANKLIQTFRLDSPDDCSDDPGELDLLEKNETT